MSEKKYCYNIPFLLVLSGTDTIRRTTIDPFCQFPRNRHTPHAGEAPKSNKTSIISLRTDTTAWRINSTSSVVISVQYCRDYLPFSGGKSATTARLCSPKAVVANGLGMKLGESPKRHMPTWRIGEYAVVQNYPSRSNAADLMEVAAPCRYPPRAHPAGPTYDESDSQMRLDFASLTLSLCPHLPRTRRCHSDTCCSSHEL
jgi:hypothetical protein